MTEGYFVSKYSSNEVDAGDWTGKDYDKTVQGNTGDVTPVGLSPSDADFEHKQENWKKFEEELRSLINRYSLETGSNTPDFVLAEFLTSVLKDWDGVWLFDYDNSRQQEWDFLGLIRETFDIAATKRDDWYAPEEDHIEVDSVWSFWWTFIKAIFTVNKTTTINYKY